MKNIDIRDLKTAVVYDWLDRWGGVERVLLTLHEMMPQARFFTSHYDLKRAGWAKELDIHPSFIQKLPHWIRKSRILSLLFYPLAFETFDFNGFDLVLSVTSSYAKAVVTKPGTVHISYLLTPSRYLWLYPHPLAQKIPKFIYRRYEKYMRSWDMIASTRPDRIISLSDTVRERCREIYRRESDVIYPPFDVSFWKSLHGQRPHNLSLSEQEDGEYYLIVSRLEPYKRVDLAVETFSRYFRRKLVVVGTGTLLAGLRMKAAANVCFLDKVTEAELKWLYSHAKALVMPQEEDFGYVSLEAQLLGAPVIAYGRGGARETVIEGKTGIFFPEQTVASLSSALERFDKISYNFRHGVKEFGPLQVEKYAKALFISSMSDIITNSVLSQA